MSQFTTGSYRKFKYPANIKPPFYRGTVSDGHQLRLLRRKWKRASEALIYAARVAKRLNQAQPSLSQVPGAG
jgi:uncharacterized protein involved in tellurium resistance